MRPHADTRQAHRAARGAGLVCVALALSAPPSLGEDIRDNSFTIEEAFNQEAGVIQHITAFTRDTERVDWGLTYTLELAVGGPEHQLGFTAIAERPADSEDGGAGDLLLNWRYQLAGGPAADVALAPRLSLVLPTGDAASGRGFGGPGLQANLPLSVQLGPRVITHVNLGVTHVFDGENELGDEADRTAWNFGESAIWLVRPRVNLMLEVLFVSGEEVVGPGRTESSQELFVTPGVRWSYDRTSGLQIVPGIGLSLGIGPSQGEESAFFYLSFER